MNEPRRSIAEPTLDGEPPILNDRYQVRRLIGKGGMGAVYLVYDRQVGTEVALKSFPPQARRSEDLAHFEHEFLTLSRLRHPNVAEVYDFGVIEGTDDVFFTSEFIDGTDLFEFSQDLPEPELIKLVVQVCRGLEYIHSRQIIHYDVKPTNILVTRDEPPRVKIIDFGLAAEHVDEALGIIKGTVSFLAPEVATHRSVDHRADLYSLGVTLFQCVTRQLPFRGDTNLDVLRKHITDPIPDPGDFGAEVSHGLRRVIRRLLSKDPGGRYQSGNLLIRELTKICGEDFAIEPREQALTFVTNGGFFGREREVAALHEAFAQIFSWSEQSAEGAPLPSPLEQTDSGHYALSLESEPDLDAERRPTDSTRISSGRLRRQPEPAPETPEQLRHLFLVTGELGVGKSRLLREFKTHAQLRRVSVVEGHAATVGSSYEPFVEVLRGILGLYHRDPDESAAGDPLRPRHTDPLRQNLLRRYGRELEQLVPELDLSDLDLPERTRLEPVQEELRLLDSLSQFLIGYGRKRPLVVLLHDLEKSDLQAWELLATLCRNLTLVESARKLANAPPLRLQVVASFRPSELSSAQRAILDALPEAAHARLQIGPLSQDEVFALIESMLGRGSNPRKLADAIYAETRGNPFFTTEVLRSLAESGGLRQEDGRWVARCEEPGSLIVPASVSDVILSRVEHTSPDERQPLGWLAVLGRSSTLRELAELSGATTPDLAAQLGALERRQVVLSERGAGPALRYDFVHLLARDAIYQSLDPGERRQLHERCGDYLEDRVREDLGAVDLGELVRHFDQAGNRRKALEYGIRAGEQACAVHAYHRAIDLFTSAMGLLPEGSPRRRGLYLQTGDLLALTGDVAQAVGIYERVLAGSEASPLPADEHARVVRGLGQLRALQGDFDGALEVLADGALRHFGDDEHREVTAGLFTAAAAIYLRTGRYADALQFAETALSQLGDLIEGEETLEAVTVRGRALLALGEVEPAEREFRRALAIARRSNHTLRQARALTDLGSVALSTGRAAEAVERFQQALRLETRLGHAAGIARNSRALAKANQSLGHVDRALELYRRALALQEKLGAPAEQVDALTDLGRALHHVGEYTQALEALTTADAEAQRLGMLDLSARALNAEAEVRERLGDVDRARELSTEALRHASLHGDVPRERARALEILGRLELDVEAEQGEQLLHQAQALFRAQGDRSGVLRTTLALLRVFLEREETLLVEGALGGIDPEGLSLRDRAWLTYTQVGAALRLQKRIPRSLLGDIERAAGWADATRDRELAWRISAARGRVLLRLQDSGSALEAYVEAMSGLRVLCASVPEALRGSYVQHPDCQSCHLEFTDLRRRLDAEAAAE
ncbi:MAG: protein kinase [Planctomycetes bacterium]|nr:protein kinase [Planctomycetota bacterium]